MPKLSEWTFKETGLAVFAASALAIASIAPAHADEANAKKLLKAMSDYLVAQKSISFQVDSTLEVVTKDGQKLGLASSGSVELSRPDKIRVTRTGGFADVEMDFDGKTLTLLGKNLNAYTQTEIPGTVDNLVDQLREKYHRPLPAADLLLSKPYDMLMEDVIDAKDLGSGVIRGKECDHLAFRKKEVDWQIWIAQGEHPYPCRFVVSSKKIKMSPQYTIEVSDWKASAEPGSVDFTFKAPEGAKMVKPEDLKDIDEIPSHFRPKQ